MRAVKFLPMERMVGGFKIWQQNPTGTFTVLKLLNPSYDVPELHKICRLLRASKIVKGSVGQYVACEFAKKGKAFACFVQLVRAGKHLPTRLL